MYKWRKMHLICYVLLGVMIVMIVTAENWKKVESNGFYKRNSFFNGGIWWPRQEKTISSDIYPPVAWWGQYHIHFTDHAWLLS